MLNNLKTCDEVSAIPFKELTLKLTMLLCLTTGQTGQTIYKIDVSCIQELPDRYRITVSDKLKQAKPGKHLVPMDLLEFQEDRKLCVFKHLKEYLKRTRQHRREHSKLLLSYIKPFKPLSKDWSNGFLNQQGLMLRNIQLIAVGPHRHPVVRLKVLI